ncbi:MAG: T9SS type A sorting domain-containing protein [Bacteroidales bacterium]|nr:T9SS type A sorting domain-containing protein [Bacteroidales bacterium]
MKKLALWIRKKNFFIDENSNPYIQSNKYKLSFKDGCTLESEKSTAHKTIHLTINQGLNNSWNLIWEPYEGFEVSTYYIYRGTDMNNLQLIGSTSGSSSQYSDYSAPTGNVFYQIEIIGPKQCNYSELKSTQATINSSRSNIATNSPTGLEKNKNQSDLLSIYPNPFNDKIIIELNRDCKNGFIEITNMDGKRIKKVQAKSDKIEIITNDLDFGVYVIKILTEKAVVSRRIIKN